MTLIAVVGPPAAGKSTVAAHLSDALGVPVVRFDADRADRYRRWGYTTARAEQHYQHGGAAALHRYETRFELRAFERALADQRSRVLDPGGGLLLQHTDRDDERLRASLRTVPLLVVALPHPHNERQCTETLAKRVRKRDPSGDGIAWLAAGGKSVLRDLVIATNRILSDGVQVVDTTNAACVNPEIDAVVARYHELAPWSMAEPNG